MDRTWAIRLVGIAWMIFCGVWLLAALRMNRAKMPEPISRRIPYILLMATAALLYTPHLNLGALDRNFPPNAGWIPALGAGLTWLGAAFAIWARLHIGRYWSGTVSLREGHRLIRTGPYARVRHPIYTGIILALFGGTLAIGEYRTVLGLIVFAIGLTWKAKREEALLSGEFGPAFDEHRRATGFLLPRLRPPAAGLSDG